MTASRLAVGRSIHSASIVRNSAFSMPSSAARARARSTIPGDAVGADQRPAGRDELGGEQPGVARARRELEHAVAGLRLDRVDEPARHRPRAGLEHRAVLAPAGRGAVPALQAGGAILASGRTMAHPSVYSPA